MIIFDRIVAIIFLTIKEIKGPTDFLIHLLRRRFSKLTKNHKTRFSQTEVFKDVQSLQAVYIVYYAGPSSEVDN